ncbi:methyltransferase-like protein 5-like isoform X2 [Hibiscus syriacus]|uniref:Methyltransferase-like protein 5-like isoform X2 n=1 Tax=Hibiscus syriacus TaxID=106335 RepID=A0A6A3ARR7_HIBSY|nr:methyltransferase-like protein 5-like isoform X2 [Hibiscus syriacus]
MVDVNYGQNWPNRGGLGLRKKIKHQQEGEGSAVLLACELEQYPTGPHIASRLLYTAENSFDDISNKVVAHFGCGRGTLGAAATLLGAKQVIGIDIDSQSLEIASMNAEDLELDINFIQCDIGNLGWRGQIVDTVVMNSPFGTRKRGIDMDFLFVALKLLELFIPCVRPQQERQVIYFQYIKRAALRDLNASSAEVLCELRFNVPKLYKFHKEKAVDIAVDL